VSINKAFVIKNGLEISTDLIIANATTRKVGIGTTVPQYILHVNGGIGVTDVYVSGIGTFANELNVGLGGTVLTVLGVGNLIGVGTANPAFLLDVRAPVSTGQTALYVQGDIRVTGDLNVDDISITNLNVSGVSTFVGFATFNNNIFVAGISTLGTVKISSGIVTATSGVVTYFGDGSNLTGMAGNPTLQTVLNTGNTSSIGMSISGVSTFTNLTGTNLNYSGISTLGTVKISSGIITATSGIVTYFGDGQYLTGILGNPTLQTVLNTGNTSSIGMSISGVSTFTNLTGTSGTITTFNSTNGTITNLTGTSGTITTFNSSSGAITNLTGTAATITNASGTVKIGIGTTALLVEGNARVTGILTVGSSSITLNGITDTINVGTGLTLSSSGINVSGVITATSFVGSGANLTGIANTANIVSTAITTGTLNVTTSAVIGSGVTINSSGINVTGVITATSFVGSGANLTGIANTANIVSTAITTGTLNVTNSAVIGSGVTINSSGINVTGVVTATSFSGSGANLTGVSAGSTVADDGTTDQTFYPIFTQTTSGTITASKVSTTKLSFNPSSGTLSATVFTSLSDETQKTNIRPVKNATYIVSQMNGVYYDWIDGHNIGSVGVIAQEMEQVLPEVVTTNDQGLKTVSYGNIVGVLIEAIKEQQVRIEELERKLNA